MTSFLILGDLHLSDRAPSACTDSYTDDLFDMLAWIADYAQENNAVVIQAGDLFHVKQPSRNSHNLVQRTIEALRKFPREVFIVPGNHDLLNDRLDSIFETQPLGTVFRSGAAKMLDGWDISGNYPIYGVPWIQKLNDISVSEAYRDFRPSYYGYDHALAITHAPLYPPGQELKFEYYPASKYADAMNNQCSVYYGHVHEAHGVWTCNGVTFCNQGALSRGSLHEHNLKRKIAVTVWNDLNGQFRRVEVPHKPAKEVFRLEEKNELQEAKISLDQFLESVGKTTMSLTSIENVIEYIKNKEFDPQLEKIIEDLLREASS